MITERDSIISFLPRGSIISRLFEYIDMICDLSLKIEISRGESYD